jgi:hypothetical protein
LVSAADDEFAPLLPPRDRLVMEPASGPGCLVFRLSGLSLSYIEMVHPADFRHDELMPGPARGALRLEHRLFPQTLEKGVILRARVRGAFVPRADDLRIAAESYRAFASAEPPLGG